MSMITLRTYQEAARDAAITMMGEAPHPDASKLHEWGARRQASLIAMATGSGKTEVWFGVLQRLLETGAAQRVLMIAHTNELVTQPVERIIKSWPMLPVPGIVKAGRNDVGHRIMSASIQTLASGERLAQLIAAGAPDLVFCDEAHRIRARSWEFVLSTIYAANPNARVLCASATPARSDRLGIGEIVGPKPAYTVSLKDAIFKLKCVTNFRAFVARLTEDSQDFSDVRRDAVGNYAVGETGRILSLQESLDTIIAKWIEVAEDRPTLATTASVEQAYALASAFRSAGYAAAAIDGSTKKAERAQVITDFRSGKLQILVGCAIFIEGFDAPRASCALIARPTQHDGTYLQMLGRALRWFDKDAGTADDIGSTDAIIIDVAPKGARDLMMAARIMDPPPAKESESPREAAKEQGLIGDPFPFYGADEVYLELMDMFAASKLAWFSDGRIHSVPLGQDAAGQSLSIAIIENGGFEVLHLKHRNRGAPGGLRRLGKFETFAEASDAANDYVEAHGEAQLVDKSKAWRRRGATDGQLGYLRSLGVNGVPESRGEASIWINHAKCLQSVKALQKKHMISAG